MTDIVSHADRAEIIDELLTKIEAHQWTGEANAKWYGSLPLDADGMAWLKERCPNLPAQFEWILARTNGGEWAGRPNGWYCGFLEASAVADINSWLGKDLPGMFAFASDGGPCFFLLNLEDRPGRSVGSVWMIAQGATFESELEYVDPNMESFLQRLLDGRRITRGLTQP